MTQMISKLYERYRKSITIIVVAIVIAGISLAVSWEFQAVGIKGFRGSIEGNVLSPKLTAGVTVEQELYATGNIGNIQIPLKSKSTTDAVLNVEVHNRSKKDMLLYSAQRNSADTDENGCLVIPIEQETHSGDNLAICITGVDGTKDNSPSLYLADTGELPSCTIDGKIVDKYMVCDMYHLGKFRIGYFLCAIGILVMIALFLLCRRIQQLLPEQIFAVIAVTIGLVFVFLNPPLQNPDEYYHFQKSIDVSYGNLSPFYLSTDGNIYTLTGPETFMESAQHAIYSRSLESDVYKAYYAGMSMNEQTVQVDSTGGFHPFISYIPQGIAAFLARLLHLNVMQAIYLVRSVNLLTAIMIMYFAIRITPIGKNLFSALLLTPISLSQMASAATDGLCNALTCLFIALVFYYALKKERQLTIRDMLPLAGILILLAFCKYLYVVSGLLVFLIPVSKFGGWKKYLRTFFAILIPLLMIFAVYYGFIGGKLLGESVYNAGVNPSEQLQLIFSHPKYLLQVYANTFENCTLIYIEQFSTLGSLNYKLGILILLTPLALMAVAFTDVSDRYQLKMWQKGILAVTGIIIILLVMLSMYLVWSVVGAGIIEGVQARYFIPALPMLLMAAQFNGNKNQIKNYAGKVGAITASGLYIAIVYMVMLCY